MNSELSILLITVVVIFVFGIPLILQKHWLPRELQFEQVPPEQLTPEQAKFFASYDAELGSLGYAPVFTYRVPNLQGKNLLRTYVNPAETARCSVTMLSFGTAQQTYAEFVTQYADGTFFTTRNVDISSVFKRLPNSIVQDCRGVTRLAELKRRHDAKAQELLIQGPMFFNRDKFFDDFRNYHIRFCEYQQSQKLLNWEPATNLYRMTVRTALNGIRNFFNPLADNFTALRFVAGLVFGAGLPVLVMLEPQKSAHWLASVCGFSLGSAWLFLLLGSYVLSGIAIGLLFRQKTFIWAFLLGYLPALLLSNRRMFGMSLLMAFSADVAFRVQSRARKLI